MESDIKQGRSSGSCRDGHTGEKTSVDEKKGLCEKRFPDENHAGGDDEAVMELAVTAGRVLLENGAEIFRVEDTVRRIYTHYGIKTGREFVLTNGVFVTAGSSREGMFARVENVTYFDSNLEKVAAVNELSREIERDMLTVDEAMERLEEIRSMKGKNKYLLILASGLGSASFCYLFDNVPIDSVCAFVAGCILYIFVLLARKHHVSRLIWNLFGAALVTLLCAAAYIAGIGTNLNTMIIGAIMPLIPGVSFTNAIRDIAEGNYLSGIVRMLDAVLVFACMAIGVAFGILLLNKFTGAVSLWQVS